MVAMTPRVTTSCSTLRAQKKVTGYSYYTPLFITFHIYMYNLLSRYLPVSLPIPYTFSLLLLLVFIYYLLLVVVFVTTVPEILVDLFRTRFSNVNLEA